LSNLKWRRAISNVNLCPSAQRTVLDHIGGSLDSLSSRQLAAVLVALDKHWHAAQRAAERGVVTEGCVWDGAHGKLVELAA
jgi:hypothetical protein